MGNTFEREDRYIVIKRSDLKLLSPVDSDLAHSYLEGVLSIMDEWNCPAREYLVIESDWPEYLQAWRSIEARMTGALPITFRADGEANFYTLMKDGNWLARVQVNGELLVCVQEALIRSMLSFQHQEEQAKDAERWRFFRACMDDDYIEKLEPLMSVLDETGVETAEQADAHMDKCIQIARDNGLWPWAGKQVAQ